MRTYFSFGRNFSKKAFGLKMDYSLAEVPDPLALNNPEPTPKDFLQKFSYEPAGADLLEDMLANNMGWCILSALIARLFSECSNRHEIELLPLPEKACRFHPKLAEYRVLGIKRQIACLDTEESDLRWSDGPRGKYVSAIYECILKERSIPENVDVFQIAEYAVMPIISSRLATAMAEFYPTGLIARVIKAVTHQE